MSKYEDLRDNALLSLRTYMDSLDEKKGTKLAYWIKDYSRFLSKESSFDPKKLIRYKRGSIVKVHLGYRVGSEEGGLHYAVVMDVDNSLASPVATVIPLTSVKQGKNIENLHRSQVYLGNELFDLLNAKVNKVIDETTALQNNLIQKMQEAQQAPPVSDQETENVAQRILASAIQDKIKEMKQKINLCIKMANEIDSMKHGSIALVGQITTVSKIRIYDPLFPSDTLSNIRLSPDSMDKLDNKIRELFTKNK